MTSAHEHEVSRGERFTFGENWQRYLRELSDARIEEAVKSVRTLLDVSDLAGKAFLDIGSGSGLFSLAARRLGARVHSFDYDPQSVACTAELKRRYFPDDQLWTVEEGSALEESYVKGLGTFDVVYSWGVLHHTGRMWEALAYAAIPVKEGGMLAIAIYNDQEGTSRRWGAVKRTYAKSSSPMRAVLLVVSLVVIWWKDFLNDLLHLRPFRSWFSYGGGRGMSPWRDLVDWVGGYPFEVAKPEEIFRFYKDRGFVLLNMKTCSGGKGCNEYVFRRTSQ